MISSAVVGADGGEAVGARVVVDLEKKTVFKKYMFQGNFRV